MIGIYPARCMSCGVVEGVEGLAHFSSSLHAQAQLFIRAMNAHSYVPAISDKKG